MDITSYLDTLDLSPRVKRRRLPSIVELPSEMLLLIFSFLPLKDLFSAVRVCKLWNSIAKNENLWKGNFWQVNVGKKLPEKRLCHCSVMYKGNMYVLCGDRPYEGSTTYNIGIIMSDINRFNFTTKTWDLNMNIGLPPLTEFNVAVHKDFVYTFGGITSQNKRCNDVYQLSLDNAKCQMLRTLGTIPPRGSCHSCVTYGDSMYIFGGWDNPRATNDLYQFHFETRTWKLLEVTGDVPAARRSHRAVVHGDSMYVFGGWTAQPENDMHRYDFLTGTWHKIQPKGNFTPCGRSRFSMSSTKTALYVYGGYDGKNYLSDLWEFQFATERWRKIGENSLPSGQHTMEIFNDTIFVFGGNDGRNAYNALWGIYLSKLNCSRA